jgi:hypothetical protein
VNHTVLFLSAELHVRYWRPRSLPYNFGDS